MKNGRYTSKELNLPGVKYAWYKDDLLHRLNGPAREWFDGTKAWYINGKRHRESGPALEYTDGDKYWYYHGKFIDCQSQEEFERIIKLLSFS